MEALGTVVEGFGKDGEERGVCGPRLEVMVGQLGVHIDGQALVAWD